MRVSLIISLFIGGNLHLPGEVVELPAAQAESLLSLGQAEPAQQKRAASAGPSQPKEEAATTQAVAETVAEAASVPEASPKKMKARG